MNDQYGVNKASLGIRYLIKYLENGRIENFDVVKDCMKEVELWCLITFFSNNIDTLFEFIPDYVLENIFKMTPTEKVDLKKLFGKGFKTTGTLNYKEQYKIIRDCLAHGRFTYDNGIIKVRSKEKDYEAIFDLLWLEKLVGTTLKNKNFALQKGMYDIVVSSAVDPMNINNQNLQELGEKGFIQFYKITSLTSNKETMASNIRGGEFTSDEITFNLIIEIVQGIAMKEQIYSCAPPQENIRKIKETCKSIEKFLGNKVSVELLPLHISDTLMADEDFRNLNVFDKFAYITLFNKYKDNDENYNFEMVNNLINLFEGMEDGTLKPLSLFILRDAGNFLLKVYSNIFFNTYRDDYAYDVALKHGALCKFVHARKIYEEYLKQLRKSYDEIETYNGFPYKRFVIGEMDNYSRLLDEVINNEVGLNFSWKMRNSITHGQIEFTSDDVKFYTTGKNIKIPRYNKKKKEWEKREFVNTKHIWELNINKQSLLKMLDELFRINGIEISVNISKYIKRKNYLK